MPELTWIGKDAVRRHHLDVPFRPLVPQYNFVAPATPLDAPQHRIIHGDNLEALKSLLPEFEGRVRCIYIDPPYNTGNEGWVYNDNVSDPRLLKWLRQVVGKEGDDLSRHDKWLCMMYPRLKLLHKLLSEDGFIFVSIDYNEEAHLRLLLNEIFGSGNFRNAIAVRRGIKNVQAQFQDINALSVGHEYIMLYSKKSNARLPKLSKELEEEKAGKWDTFWRGTDRPTMRYALLGQNPERGQWRWEEGRASRAVQNYHHYLGHHAHEMTLDEYFFDHLTSTNEKLEMVRRTEEGVVQYYVAPQATKLVSDNWMDITLSGGFTRFETEKSTEIIERVISWVCPPDSIILDSFAGSGTTLHAVLNLNARDGEHGRRQCLLIEMEDYAETLTAERVRRVAQGYGSTPGTGGSFGFYTLGPAIFGGPVIPGPDGEAAEPSDLVPGAPAAALRQYVWYSETALPLPAPVETSTGPDHPAYLGTAPDGTRVYLHYNPAADTVLDRALAQALRPGAPRYVVYADACLLSETQRTSRGVVFKKIPRDIVRF